MNQVVAIVTGDRIHAAIDIGCISALHAGHVPERQEIHRQQATVIPTIKS